MSADTTNEPAASAAANTETSPGMGGASTEENGLAGGAETQTQETPEGASPEGEQAAGEEPEARTDPKAQERERYVADLEQRVVDADAIARTIMADPERMRAFESWSKSDRGEGGGVDVLASVETDIAKYFPDREDNPQGSALRAIVTPLIAEIRALRKGQAEMRPDLQKAHAAVTRGEFHQGLVANGVPANILSDKGFLQFLTELRRDPDFARDERTRARYAAKFAATSWKARTGQRQSNAQQRQHVEDMKGGRLHAAAAPGPTGGGAPRKVYTLDPTKPGYDAQALAIRTKDPSAQIEYRAATK